MSISIKRKQGGFLVLTMVLLVSATVLAIATGLMLRSIGDVNDSGDTENSFKAWSTVNACGESALFQLASTTEGNGWSTYLGGESLSVGDNSCYIYAIVDSGSAKIIQASSTVSGFTKKIEIKVATNTPTVSLDYWKEVADF